MSLLSLTVSNHRAIGEPVTWEPDGHASAGLIGELGTGKSSVLGALKFLQYTLFPDSEFHRGRQGISCTPHTTHRNEQSTFDLAFQLDRGIFRYRLEVGNDHGVYREHLGEVDNELRPVHTVFDRDCTGLAPKVRLPALPTRTAKGKSMANMLIGAISGQPHHTVLGLLAPANPDAGKIFEIAKAVGQWLHRSSPITTAGSPGGALGIDLPDLLVNGSHSQLHAVVPTIGALVPSVDVTVSVSTWPDGSTKHVQLDVCDPLTKAVVPLEQSSPGTRNAVIFAIHVAQAIDRGGRVVADDLTSIVPPSTLARARQLLDDLSANPRGAQLLYSGAHPPTGAAIGAVTLVERDRIGQTALVSLPADHGHFEAAVLSARVAEQTLNADRSPVLPASTTASPAEPAKLDSDVSVATN